MTDDIKLKAIAKSWSRKYTKREVEIMLASDRACTPLEKDKLQYYFNCYNENGEVVHPYSCGERNG